MENPPQKILVRSVNWLGDAIMSTPALHRLRQARPGAKILLLTPEKLAGLWEEQPFLDGLITFKAGESAWQVSRRLRAENFSEAVVFPNSFRSALETWLARIPRRLGLGRGRSFFLTHPIAPRPGALPMRKRSAAKVRSLVVAQAPPETIPMTAHHVHDYLYLTSHLGAAPEPMAPRIWMSQEQAVQLCQKLRLGPGTPDRPWFGLNPGAEYGPAKRWPMHKFAAVAGLLQKRMRCRWVIFGGPGDVALCERLATEIRFGGHAPDGVLNLAGRTTLRELAAGLKLCRVLLTNDTGPMHLAAAVGTPVVAAFGSTAPEMTAPVFNPNVEILRQPAPCSPCFRRECPIDLRCLENISNAQAFEAVQHALHLENL